MKNNILIDAWRAVEVVVDAIFTKFLRLKFEPMYWLRCHTFNRYHIINVSGQDGYKWGWCDTPQKMEYACFKLLVDFVENEFPGHIDWDHEQMRDTRDEFLELYRWWTSGKKEEEEACSKLFDECGFDWGFEEINDGPANLALEKLYSMRTSIGDKKKYDEYVVMSKALEEKNEEMLLRLIKVRHHLWT